MVPIIFECDYTQGVWQAWQARVEEIIERPMTQAEHDHASTGFCGGMGAAEYLYLMHDNKFGLF